MPEMMTASWFPVLTLLIGFGTKSLSDWFDHRRTATREREAREWKKKDQLLERRVNFQHETLLALQEACMKLARTIGAAHHLDMMANQTAEVWQKNLLPEELSENSRLAFVSMMTLSARVSDGTARDLADKFRQHCAETLAAHSVSSSETSMANAMDALVKLNQRIGSLLRSLDDIEDGDAGGIKVTK
jgi:hypothetical protein